MHTAGEGLFQEIERLKRELAEEQQKNARLSGELKAWADDMAKNSVQGWAAACRREEQKNTLLQEQHAALLADMRRPQTLMYCSVCDEIVRPGDRKEHRHFIEVMLCDACRKAGSCPHHTAASPAATSDKALKGKLP